MKIILINSLFSIPLFFILNGCISEPTLEDTVSYLNNLNDDLFNEEKDLKHVTFSPETVTFSLRVIYSDNETDEFKKNVESIVVTCFAESLSKITSDTATSLSFHRKGKTMYSLKVDFSSPCKVNNNRVTSNYDELGEFYGKQFNLYYWNWNENQFNNYKQYMKIWGKLNRAFISS